MKKGKPTGRTWNAALTCVGMQFRWKMDGRKVLAGAVPFKVELEREPDNEHDSDAIKVIIASDFKLTKLKGKHLGYLRKNIAALIAPKLDSGAITPVKLWVTEIDPFEGTAEIDARFRDRPKKPAKRASRQKVGKGT